MTSALDSKPATGAASAGPGGPAPVRRRRRGLIIAIVVAVLVVAAVGIAIATRSSSSTASSQSSVVLKPVAVVKRDLNTYTDVAGTLGYGDPVTISEGGAIAVGGSGNATSAGATTPSTTPTAPAASGARGGGAQQQAPATTAPSTTSTTAPASNTVTMLAPEGTALKRGDVIYAIDNRPRVLMYGTTPAWRDLSSATTPGADVTELKLNLAALGYDPDHQMTSDNVFDYPTLAAVYRWQAALGYEQTGVVSTGQIVFLPGPIRVGTHSLDVGTIARPGTPITQATVTEQVDTTFGPNTSTVEAVSSKRQVTANVNVADRASMKVGDPVQIEFADKSQKPGKITDLGALAAKTSNTPNASPTVTVTATLDDNSSLDPSLVSTPVDVLFVKDSSTGVLAVPTAALVSLKEGGFAVQVSSGGSTKLVGVKTGLYSDGFVEISGNGIAEGTQVMVPS